jgi:hypothetical protein
MGLTNDYDHVYTYIYIYIYTYICITARIVSSHFSSFYLKSLSDSGFNRFKIFYILMPIILATQEAEIRRITVLNQLRQIVHETLS